MRSIFILYMPGHAGNFLNRLFSLSDEAVPQITQRDLDNAINTKQLSADSKDYSFRQVRTDYADWQQFHRDFVDFADSDKVELLNQICADRFTHAVYSIHPMEFAQYAAKILAKDSDLYHVELDLGKFGEWVESARRELKFVTRPNEEQLFGHIVKTHNTTAISLTQMLESETDFCNEYVRVCRLMQITPVVDRAIQLYRDWRQARVDTPTLAEQHTQSIRLFSRAPNDEFTYSLFNELLATVSCEYDAYYAWSNPPENLVNFLQRLHPHTSNVVLGLKDLLDLWKDFNWWRDTVQGGTELIIELANRYPEKNFVIFTSLENLTAEVGNVENIQLVNWGGDLLNQCSTYPTLVPVLDKNFNTDTTFISLNRNPRVHRLVLLGYLFGAGYNQHGIISYLGQQIAETEQDNLLDLMPWRFDMERHSEVREQILSGYKQIYNNKSLALDDYKIYQTVNNNVANFDQSLRAKYQNSFVEIVTESSFSAPAYLITEKFLNSVYGCNFPILLSGAGAVAHLREMGFDMFDDIVDHSYDLIVNPFDRIISAVELNKQLLMDLDYVKQLWKSNQDRFEKNVAFAKIGMYKWYRARAIAQFNSVQWR